MIEPVGIADSSRELMAWIAELEDVNPFELAETDALIKHALEGGLILEADIPAVLERLVRLVDRGLLGATDPLASIQQPIPVPDRATSMSEIRTTAEGRDWVEDANTPSTAGPMQAPSDSREPRKVAVMHGRDDAARTLVFDLLRRLSLEPLEWDQLVDRTDSAAPYNGEAVAAAFRVAQAVVVVLTPDDVGFLHPSLQGVREGEDDRDPTGQPRLNVVLEAGMALQSHPTQTVLVGIGHTRSISDLAGRNTVRLDGSPGKFNSLATRLEGAGCPVNRQGNDWLDLPAFTDLDALRREPPPDQTESLARSSNSDARTGAPESERKARREAQHLFVELATIDRTAEAALESGCWWNVMFEGLPATQWEVGRDVLADESPRTYAEVAPAYVEADQMNKAANNSAQGGYDLLTPDAQRRLLMLRNCVDQAQHALKRYADESLE